VDVLLDDAGPLPLRRGLFHQLLYFFEFFGHNDAVASVGVFAGLDDPDVLFVGGDDAHLLLLRLLRLHHLLRLDFLLLIEVEVLELVEFWV